MSTDTPSLTSSDSPQAIRHNNEDVFVTGAGEVMTNVGSVAKDSDLPYPEPQGTDPWAPSH